MADSKKAAFDALIKTRIYNFSYLSRVHGVEGEAAAHWLNIFKLEAEDLQTGMPGVGKWIALGLALSSYLTEDGETLVNRALEAFELFTANNRYNISSKDKILEYMEKAVEDVGEYPNLHSLDLPFTVSNTETIFTTCDVMCKLYEKLGKTDAEVVECLSFREKMERFDKLVKATLLVKLCNNMNNHCSSKAKQIMYSIDSLYALNKVKHS